MLFPRATLKNPYKVLIKSVISVYIPRGISNTTPLRAIVNNNINFW